MGHFTVPGKSEKMKLFYKFIKYVFQLCYLLPFIGKNVFGYSALEWYCMVWEWGHEVITKFTELNVDIQRYA